MRWKAGAITAVAIAVTTGLTGAVCPDALPAAHAYPAPAAPATQAAKRPHITNVKWYSDQRVAVWVYSPAMNKDIQVQILLARDWNKTPDATFPLMYALDGMRARDDQSGWILNTDIENFYKDKNVNVVMPIGGQSSFYTNWKKPDNGLNYQWETFLIKELPPILETTWRTSKVRGVEGLSMGGTAAMMLAGRNPGFFKFAASYSGILQISTAGMPYAIKVAMLDAGGFNSDDMFGGPQDPAWAQHDPYMLTQKLRGTSLYISSGNGLAGRYDIARPGDPEIPANVAAMGLEMLSRITSQSFARKLAQEGIPAHAVYRPSGTHTWPYWQFEMHQAWPQAAIALGLPQNPPPCDAGGAIGDLAKKLKGLGGCLTTPYSVKDGVAQDFRDGRIFWSKKTGAHVVGGAIGGAYVGAGSANGYLGLPITDEMGTPDGRARFNVFQNGVIYWSPATGPHAVRGEILKAWAKAGFENSPLGLPLGDEISTPNGKGRVQGFQRGAYYWSPATGAHAVQGAIYQKYGATGYEAGPLGFPLSSEIPLARGGRLTRFEGGNIYWTPQHGAHVMENSPIMAAWATTGYENGKLGYPITDRTPVPGGFQVTFEHGTIVDAHGKIQIKQ